RGSRCAGIDNSFFDTDKFWLKRIKKSNTSFDRIRYVSKLALSATGSAEARGLFTQGGRLRIPVGQTVAFLFDHCCRRVIDEVRVAELAFAFFYFAFDAGDLLVQPRAFGAEVDQPLQRN